MELYFQIAELVALGGFVWWFRGWQMLVEIKLEDALSRVVDLEAVEQVRTSKELNDETE